MFTLVPQPFSSLEERDRRDSPLLQLERFAVSGNTVELVLQTDQALACCPCCGQLSRQVHSRYTRKLGDLPWQGRSVRLHLRVRRFFCLTSACPRTIFAERFP